MRRYGLGIMKPFYRCKDKLREGKQHGLYHRLSRGARSFLTSEDAQQSLNCQLAEVSKRKGGHQIVEFPAYIILRLQLFIRPTHPSTHPPPFSLTTHQPFTRH